LWREHAFGSTAHTIVDGSRSAPVNIQFEDAPLLPPSAASCTRYFHRENGKPAGSNSFAASLSRRSSVPTMRCLRAAAAGLDGVTNLIVVVEQDVDTKAIKTVVAESLIMVGCVERS
jgi:hypothetical protein